MQMSNKVQDSPASGKKLHAGFLWRVLLGTGADVETLKQQNTRYSLL
jgi:hypothetical protein